MDQIGILKRAFAIAWRYRVLWVFGILLAIVAPQGNGNGLNFQIPSVPSQESFNLQQAPQLPHWGPGTVGVLATVVIFGVLLLVLLFVLSQVVKYLATIAVIRLVDDHEATGEKRTAGQGFQMGWSRATWRLFLIDLVVGLVAMVVVLVPLVVALLPLLAWITGNSTAGWIGTAVTIALLIPVFLILLAVSIGAGLLRDFAHRVCALDHRAVFESIRLGYRTIRGRLKDVGIMWLLMVGVSLGWVIITLVVFGVFAVVGLFLGGGPALLIGLLSSTFVKGAVPWLLAGAVGLPICVLVVLVPAFLLQAFYLVFRSSVWTLTYREVRIVPQAEAPA